MCRLAEFPEDLALVERAVKAIQYEAEPLQLETVVMGCRSGDIDVFIHGGTVAAAFYQPTSAQIILLYREGEKAGLKSDLNAVMQGMVNQFECRHINHVYCNVNVRNKKYSELLFLYMNMFSFKPESTIMHTDPQSIKGAMICQA